MSELVWNCLIYLMAKSAVDARTSHLFFLPEIFFAITGKNMTTKDSTDSDYFALLRHACKHAFGLFVST